MFVRLIFVVVLPHKNTLTMKISQITVVVKTQKEGKTTT